MLPTPAMAWTRVGHDRRKSARERGICSILGRFSGMDGIKIVGQRELLREFEGDRHSQASLAKAFELLGHICSQSTADCDSVQDAVCDTHKPVFQESI